MSASEDMQQAPEAPAEPTSAPTPPWWRRRPLIIGGAVVLAAAGVGIGFAVNSGPGTIQVHGVLALGPLDAIDTTTGTPANGDACEATSGYDDISAGTAVVVGNGTGQTIGTGTLSPGIEAHVDDSAGEPLGNCSFQFSVNVPAGEDEYTVTISHRGTQVLTADQLKSGILLTLGDS